MEGLFDLSCFSVCLVVFGERLKRGAFCSALSVYGKSHVAHFQEF